MATTDDGLAIFSFNAITHLKAKKYIGIERVDRLHPNLSPFIHQDHPRYRALLRPNNLILVQFHLRCIYVDISCARSISTTANSRSATLLRRHTATTFFRYYYYYYWHFLSSVAYRLVLNGAVYVAYDTVLPCFRFSSLLVCLQGRIMSIGSIYGRHHHSKVIKSASDSLTLVIFFLFFFSALSLFSSPNKRQFTT